jgi:hypothetical protein
MLNKSKFLLLALLFVLASSTLAVIRGVKRHGSGLTLLAAQNNSQQKAEPNSDDDLPVYDPAVPADGDEKKEARRKAKGKRYSNSNFPISSLEASDNITHTGEVEPTTALPVTESNLIVICEVSKAEAILSSDGSSLYSEFTLRVKEVLKNGTAESLGKGDSILVERLGGRFKSPSGKLVTERVSGTKMPLVGKKYLLFLIRHPDNSTFIRAGYNLSGDKVMALDNYEHNLTTKYNGEPVLKLLSDINLALSAANSTALTMP